jgi:hypothetical protein
MDWFIYNLIGDVVTHYWYGVQCKNWLCEKQKGIVVNALLSACDIPNTNVLLHLDGEDIAFCGIHQPLKKSVDNICSSFKMVECNCPFVAQGIFCKHVMKVSQCFIKTLGTLVQLLKRLIPYMRSQGVM